ncbi:MAG: carboxylesterase family protein, partial [Thermoguttaceae bacterium]|nr:carboxylesterase family protein [Thermoguttaceae bacterium]
LAAFVTACCMTAVFADDLPTRDVPYYSADAPGSGNLEYRALRCMLDVYVPQNAAADAKLPVVVWFHGGGLSGGSKHEVSDLTNHGIIVVSVNYRLRPNAKSRITSRTRQPLSRGRSKTSRSIRATRRAFTSAGIPPAGI